VARAAQGGPPPVTQPDQPAVAVAGQAIRPAGPVPTKRPEVTGGHLLDRGGRGLAVEAARRQREDRRLRPERAGDLPAVEAAAEIVAVQEVEWHLRAPGLDGSELRRRPG